MEDSGKRHSQENKVLLEKNMKRRYKTRAQVMALETFYNEHKYPTEEMKSQHAEQIGLTEKQVSGWFCHRRLKEKRLSGDEGIAGGRQDRSSGIIQDRGSGLRQDSCGSTKQGDCRSIDPREVQSQMFYGHDFPAADLAYDHGSPYTAHAVGRDDTSSENSSFMQDRPYSQSDYPYAMETSTYIRQNGAITPVNHNSTRSKEYKPSGYLKVKGEAENVAISAVKRQLGRHYWEDGPPLGVEFDPLPLGAFESPSGDPVNEPFYIGNSRWPRSSDVPEIGKQHALGTRYEVDSAKMDFQDSYIGENINSKHGSDYKRTKSHHQLKQKSPLLHYLGSSPCQKSSLHIHEDSDRKNPVYDNNQGYSSSSKHDAGWMGLDSVMNRHDPYCVGSSKSLDAEERGASKKMAKVKKLYRERKAIRGHRDPVKVKAYPAIEMTVAKRAKVDFSQQDYMAKASYAEIPRWAKQIKGSVAYMPSSFSKDETAKTSSSMD